MRRWLALVGITAALALGLTVAAPPGAAQALCLTSIDPKCAGANLPILVDAGIVAAEVYANGGNADNGTATKTHTTTAKPTGSRGGGILGLVLSGAAAILGMVGIDWLFGDSGATGKGVMSDNGVVGQRIKTDPNYVELPTTACSFYASGDAAFAGGTAGKLCAWGPYATLGFDFKPATGLGTTMQYGQLKVTLMTAPNPNSAQFGTHYYCNTAAGVRTYGGYAGPGQIDFTPGKWTGVTLNYACPPGMTISAVLASSGQSGAGPYMLVGLVGGGAGVPGKIAGLVTVTVQCYGASGVARMVVATVQAAANAGESIALPDTVCAPGEVAGGVGVTFAPIGKPAETIVPQTEAPAPIKQLPALYPECYQPRAEPCTLRLYKIGPDGSLENCGPTGLLCPDWAKQPNAGDRYECMYGDTIVDINLCSAYRNPGVGILPNTNPDGSTIPYTAPTPPGYPNQVTKPNGSPLNETEWGGDSSPAPGAAECFPTGWGVLNPISWVIQPVGCALRAAFVPKVGKVDQSRAQLDSKWKRTTVAKYVAAVGILDFTEATGCQGIAVNMSWLKLPGVGVYYFLPACPGDFFAGIAPLFKVFIGGSLVVGGFIAVTRQLGAIFGYRGIGQSD